MLPAGAVDRPRPHETSISRRGTIILSRNNLPHPQLAPWAVSSEKPCRHRMSLAEWGDRTNMAALLHGLKTISETPKTSIKWMQHRKEEQDGDNSTEVKHHSAISSHCGMRS